MFHMHQICCFDIKALKKYFSLPLQSSKQLIILILSSISLSSVKHFVLLYLPHIFSRTRSDTEKHISSVWYWDTHFYYQIDHFGSQEFRASETFCSTAGTFHCSSIYNKHRHLQVVQLLTSSSGISAFCLFFCCLIYLFTLTCNYRNVK